MSEYIMWTKTRTTLSSETCLRKDQKDRAEADGVEAELHDKAPPGCDRVHSTENTALSELFNNSNILIFSLIEAEQGQRATLGQQRELSARMWRIYPGVSGGLSNAGMCQ